MKKIFAIILALAMTFALSATALAESEPTGTITIGNAVPGQTYSIYKMFDVETYVAPGENETEYQVVYKVVAAWKPFFADGAPGHAYITLDVNDHPTWVEGAVPANFAAAAIDWATADPDGEGTATAPRIAPTDSKLAGTGEGTPPRTTVEFTGLELGYYLIDSTLGALCTITTTHPTATVEDKNTPPTVDKTPDDTESGVGDIVTYTAHIYNIGGQTKVKFTDSMTGLVYVAGSLEVYLVVGETETSVADTNYTLTVAENLASFTVDFEDYASNLAAASTLKLVYQAKVTEAAVSVGADNEATVTYGDNNSSTGTVPSPTVLNTSFKIHKYYVTEQNQEALLADATFRLSRTVTRTDEDNNTTTVTQLAYWKADTDGNYTLGGWADIPAGENPTIPTVPEGYTYDIKTNATNDVELKGLGAGTYTLKETVAPDGYNLLTDPITVTITYTEPTGEATVGTFATTYVIGAGESKSAPVKVLNQKGGELPGVGGIGTTIFYIIGALLMVGAAVLLIVRKKMSVMD